MKLKIRYENEWQSIDLDLESVNKLWVSLDLEDEEGLTEEDREERIQKAFDDRFNKPEYNEWHRWNRHIDPNPKARRMDGRTGYVQTGPDDEGFDIMDYLAVTKEDHTKEEHDEVCAWVRKILWKKPQWAEAFIAVRIDGKKIRSYANEVGESENSITQKLARATKKLRENYRKP